MSYPAVNVRPAPCRTTALTASDSAACSIAAVNPDISSSLSVFIFSGRLSVTTATPSRSSYRTGPSALVPAVSWVTGASIGGRKLARERSASLTFAAVDKAIEAAGLVKPDGGRAWVLGHDVVAEAEVVRASIGLAGQFAAVDENLTGYENLRMVGQLNQMSRASSRSRARELLGRFGLDEEAERPAKTFSGGQRRRLDLAAALVSHPPVLFLDEPTTGLDPQSRQDLWEMIEGLVREGTTVLLTTQYLEEAD